MRCNRPQQTCRRALLRQGVSDGLEQVRHYSPLAICTALEFGRCPRNCAETLTLAILIPDLRTRQRGGYANASVQTLPHGRSRAGATHCLVQERIFLIQLTVRMPLDLKAGYRFPGTLPMPAKLPQHRWPHPRPAVGCQSAAFAEQKQGASDDGFLQHRRNAPVRTCWRQQC